MVLRRIALSRTVALTLAMILFALAAIEANVLIQRRLACKTAQAEWITNLTRVRGQLLDAFDAVSKGDNDRYLKDYEGVISTLRRLEKIDVSLLGEPGRADRQQRITELLACTQKMSAHSANLHSGNSNVNEHLVLQSIKSKCEGIADEATK
jgi:hypothetical protein